MLDVALRCSSIAESSSNIESVISVHVGGSGASDVVFGGRAARWATTCWALLGARRAAHAADDHVCMFSSSACSRTTCRTSCSSDHSSPPSPRPPARQPDAHISHTGTPTHAQPTRAPPRLFTLRFLPGAGFLSKTQTLEMGSQRGGGGAAAARGRGAAGRAAGPASRCGAICVSREAAPEEERRDGDCGGRIERPAPLLLRSLVWLQHDGDPRRPSATRRWRRRADGGSGGGAATAAAGGRRVALCQCPMRDEARYIMAMLYVRCAGRVPHTSWLPIGYWNSRCRPERAKHKF